MYGIQTGGRGGRIFPNSHAIVLQQCGQCRGAGRMKRRLTRAQTTREVKQYLVKAKRYHKDKRGSGSHGAHAPSTSPVGAVSLLSNTYIVDSRLFFLRCADCLRRIISIYIACIWHRNINTLRIRYYTCIICRYIYYSKLFRRSLFIRRCASVGVVSDGFSTVIYTKGCLAPP